MVLVYHQKKKNVFADCEIIIDTNCKQSENNGRFYVNLSLYLNI